METNKKIGLFGGSFDPVHSGHVQLATLSRDELGLDTVFFIPAYKPPHKQERELASAHHRLAMLRLALAPFPFCSISLLELEREETTYTYQTVARFREAFPGAEVFFILGTDSLAELGTWRNIGQLARMTCFVAGPRPGADGDMPPGIDGKVHRLAQPVMDVSSSEIRRRVREGLPLEGLVPDPVAGYIREHGLYRRADAPGGKTE